VVVSWWLLKRLNRVIRSSGEEKDQP